MYCKPCWTARLGRLYTSKLPVTSVHALNETTLPFFETHQAQVYTVLSNSGREFYWRPDHHPYELLLHQEEIEHRTTKVRRPQSNGFIERLHRPCSMNTSVSRGGQLGMSQWGRQTDLGSYLEHYNTQRPDQGRMMEGQPPPTAC